MKLMQKERIEQEKKDFLEHLEHYQGNARQAGLKIDINHVYKWLRYHCDKDPEFDRKYEEIKEEIRNHLVDDAESVLYEKVFVKKETAAVMYFLKCKGKDRNWLEYKEVEGGTGNIVIKIVEEDALDGKKTRVHIESAEDVSKAGGHIQ